MITADGNLHIYVVNVGQGDTTIIVSPEGRVIVIDIMRPAKIRRLLSDLGHNPGDPIAHLVVTHPHSDHFSGGNNIADAYTIQQATVAPFWHVFGMGPVTYQRLMGRLYDGGTNVTFLSGYSRWYSGSMMRSTSGDYPEVDPDVPFMEMLGPTNGLIRMLEDSGNFNTNHLSIMLRVQWRRFRMIIGGDAQMENWSFFDQERLMESNCQVFRTSHHGSSNGTQWERLDRLNAGTVIVSSNPGSGHRLPDLTAAAIFMRYNNHGNRMSVLTSDTGTIHIQVNPQGTHTMRYFGDGQAENINLANGQPLRITSNPTDWRGLLEKRLEDF